MKYDVGRFVFYVQQREKGGPVRREGVVCSNVDAVEVDGVKQPARVRVRLNRQWPHQDEDVEIEESDPALSLRFPATVVESRKA
jgi:hypothetical protein